MKIMIKMFYINTKIVKGQELLLNKNKIFKDKIAIENLLTIKTKRNITSNFTIISNA